MPLRGVTVDPETRCEHYNGSRDVIAIQFPCCDVYYPCHVCHEASTDHPPGRWSASQRSEGAVLCGVCRHIMSITDYLDAKHECPACGVPFNPGCQQHWDKYFAFST